MAEAKYPMRVNKYLAHKNYCTRRAADEMIAAGKVLINGHVAQLGDKVNENDTVEVRFGSAAHRYFAYHKPRGIITHSPAEGERDIRQSIPLVGVFPVGRLDKDSSGLIILTDDGRITDTLLNPAHAHEKEYIVTTNETLPSHFKTKMEAGVNIEGYVTKPAKVKVLSPKKFFIILTEGKKHQIRRMVAFFGLTTVSLERVRVMNIGLAGLKEGDYRPILGHELKAFLKSLGVENSS